MLLLNDEQFAEGIIGGLASIFVLYFYRKQEKHKGNLFVVILVSWAIFWYIRKIGMNLYKQEKKDFDSTFSMSRIKRLLTTLSIPLLVYFFLIRGRKLPFKKLTRFSARDLGLLSFMVILGFLVYP